MTRSQLRRLLENADYWRDREEKQRASYIRTEEEEMREVNRIYKDMYRWAEREISAFYGKYASAEGIDITEAKRRVSQLDIEAYEELARKYVKDRDFSERASQEMRLYNATMKINRMELLKAQIGVKLVDGFNDIDKHYEKIATDRAVQELERMSGILGNTLTDTETAKYARNIVNADFYNANFSERIWSHADNLKDAISTELQKGFISGVSSQKMAQNIKKQFEVSYKDAHRLVVTELRRVQTDVARQQYEESGIEEYEYCAVNPRACPICKDLDGQVFKVSEMRAGENAPPIHPNCHCTTAPKVDEDEYEKWLTWLENGGTTAQWDQMSDQDKQSWFDRLVNNIAQDTGGFKPATTIQEANEYAKSFTDSNAFGAVGVDYSGVSVEVANTINKALSDLYNKYNVKKFGGIIAPKGNTKLGKLIEGATAGYSPIRNSFLLNRKSLKSEAIANKEFRDEQAVVTRYLNNPNAFDRNKLSKQALETLENSRTSGRATVPKTVEEVIWHEFGHALEKQIQKDAEYNNLKDRQKDYAKNISGYACESFSEYVAESFCSYQKGEDLADPELVKAFERLER